MNLANAQFNNFFNKVTDNKYYIEKFVVDENDENSSVTILTRNIAENSIVLDIGCAQGKFGEYLHDVKGCKMYGIEINTDAIEYVKNTGKYEDVFCFNVELDDNSNEYRRFDSSISQVDYIIISDVLEHLSDPTTSLRKMGQKLKYGGKILISVPNIGHADIYLNLMKGVFNYSDLGILDNTHLKFFTKSSFVQWINEMNNYYNDSCYDCSFLGGTFYYGEYLWSIKENCKPLFSVIETNPNFNVLQLLFALTKLPPKSKTPELAVLLNEPVIDLVQSLNELICVSANTTTLSSMYAGERQWHDARNNLLTSQVQSLSVQNGELQHQAEWLKARNGELERQIACQEEQNRQFEILLKSEAGELAAMRNTLSWRITGPLRWLRQISKRIIGRA